MSHPTIWLTFAIPLLVRAHGACRIVVSVAVEDFMQGSDVEASPAEREWRDRNDKPARDTLDMVVAVNGLECFQFGVGLNRITHGRHSTRGLPEPLRLTALDKQLSLSRPAACTRRRTPEAAGLLPQRT